MFWVFFPYFILALPLSVQMLTTSVFCSQEGRSKTPWNFLLLLRSPGRRSQMLQPGSNRSFYTSHFSFNIFLGTKLSTLILYREGCYLSKLPTQWNPMERQGKDGTQSMAKQKTQPRSSSHFSSMLLLQNSCAFPIQQTSQTSARLFGHIYTFKINGISQSLARFWHPKRLLEKRMAT